MPPGYKVCCAPTILRLVRCHCSCFSLPIGALRRSFRRLNGGLSPSISSYYPPCHYTARCIFRCQAYGPIARVRLETPHCWCGAADGMCIETNSKPDGFCVSFVDRYLRTNILCSSDPSFVCHSQSLRRLEHDFFGFCSPYGMDTGQLVWSMWRPEPEQNIYPSASGTLHLQH